MNKEVAELQIEKEKIYSHEQPVKIHLKDGGMIAMPKGFQRTVMNDSIFLLSYGDAIHYDLMRANQKSVSRIFFDEVAYVESITESIDGVAFISSLPGVATLFGIGAIAIFGSCPTYYSLNSNEEILEAEGFSYSISKKFELEDLDKMKSAEVHNGLIKMKLKNEALETHYLNKLELVEVRHESDFEAFPMERENFLFQKFQEVILVGKESLIQKAINASGVDITDQISARDECFYSSPVSFLEKVKKDTRTKDYIELELSPEKGKKELFLALKLRNSLLNTILFYEVILNDQNFSSIDWVAENANSTIYAYKFYQWYKKYFGLKIELFKDGSFEEIDRVGDMGPICWSEVGLVLDVPDDETIRLRLSFIPDNWHIDWVGASFEGSKKPQVQVHSIGSMIGNQALNFPNVIDQLGTDDENYFINYPGGSYELTFNVGQGNMELDRSWMLSSKGYYVEWLRKEWLEPGNNQKLEEEINLDDNLVKTLYHRWEDRKENFEANFFETMVPTND
jgi:hypothetical protein